MTTPAFSVTGLAAGFIRSAETFPDRPALECEGEVLSYSALRERAMRVRAGLAAVETDAPRLTAILGTRSVDTFAGILGALLHGNGYVPLNPEYPVARNAQMLERSGATTLVVDRAGMPFIPALLERMTKPLTVFALGVDHSEPTGAVPGHRVFGARELPSAPDGSSRPVAPDDTAYVLFTSGTTGRPKGVAVTHANVQAFVRAACERFRPTYEDRFSQTFELTFDLSVFDMFVPWEKGATVCCASGAEKLAPARYIADRGLTVWFSVPTAAVMLGRLKQLKPGQYPSLRWSLFCGEALPRNVVESWAQAAPNSIVENLYGPTELTIACMCYRWDSASSPALCENGIVPIGWPLPGMSAAVVDEQLNEVAPGEIGELVMTGPQLTAGYIDDPAKTEAAFVPIGDSRHVHYRTGDLVRRPIGDRPMMYLSRADTQIKIRGFRVELGEIEAAVRDAANTSVAVAVPWPRTESGADGLIVFVEEPELDLRALTLRVRENLPSYMHPQQIRYVATIPKNTNGKVDRKAVETLLLEK